MTTKADLDHGSEQTTLPLEIHAATRSCHTALNRLIVARLPLCLPPHAASPATYAQGIATLGQIYLSFEQVWDECLASSTGSHRTDDLLRQLQMPSLSRTTRLNADLSLLALRIGSQEHLQSAEQEEVMRLTSRIRRVILQRPHLLMSYAWVMYMALFNGGRWIRDQLAWAGTEFWGTESFNIDCLSFWEFAGDEDGDDIKHEFVTQFNVVAGALSERERQDVVDEAIQVFEACAQLVALLDQKTQLGSPEAVAGSSATSWIAAGYAAASSAVSGIWSFLSSQRSDSTSKANGSLPKN